MATTRDRLLTSWAGHSERFIGIIHGRDAHGHLTRVWQCDVDHSPHSSQGEAVACADREMARRREAAKEA
jgi:hypothetical protein